MAILLQRDVYWPVEKLARRFGTSTRSVYRYLQILESQNFKLEKDDRNRYRIAAPAEQYLPEFDPDEYIFLQEAVAAVTDKHPLREGILEKIKENLDMPALGALASHQLSANMLRSLLEAMEKGVCVRLKDYYSLHTGEIANKVIEPIRLIRGMRYVLGVDRKTGGIRQYKIDRMTGVEILKTKCTLNKKLPEYGVDDFFMNGHKGFTVRIGLTEKAANLLQEDFGVKKESLLPHPDPGFPHLYEARVFGNEGVGRFVLGLIDQVRVYSPERFKSYIRKKIISSVVD